MDLWTKQIKTEPQDEIEVEDVNISELFLNETTRSSTYDDAEACDKRQVPVEIVREDAGPDEIVKEEPKIYDEYEEEESLKRVNRRQRIETMPSETKNSNDGNKNGPSKKNSSRKRSNVKKTFQIDRNGKSLEKAKLLHSEKIVKYKRQTIQRKNNSETKLLPNASFECFLCKVTLSSASNLKRHYDRFHGKKAFQCNLCSKQFSVKFSLDIHQRSHTGAKPFKCKICSRDFATQNNLRRHNESCRPMDREEQKAPKFAHDQNRKYECYLCKIDVSMFQDLKAHLTKHSGGNALPCNVCRRIFSVQSDLVQHMLSHTMQKPFECDVCLNRFTTKRNLKRHNRLHTRKGLFQCSHCPKEYTTKFTRDAHERKHI